jgi:hypothetical protein
MMRGGRREILTTRRKVDLPEALGPVIINPDPSCSVMFTFLMITCSFRMHASPLAISLGTGGPPLPLTIPISPNKTTPLFLPPSLPNTTPSSYTRKACSPRVCGVVRLGLGFLG